MRWSIIGAGPAGLAAGLELSRSGLQPEIFEAHPDSVGGLSRTVHFGGCRFDLGGHRFFTKNAEIQQIWQDLMGRDLLEVNRLSRIFFRGRFVDYPLRFPGAVLSLPPWEATACLLSFLWARLRPRTVVSFEDWVVNEFGWRLYSCFFNSYTEKVWGMRCQDIGADWARQRIRGLNLWELVRDVFMKRRGQAAIKTLTDQFQYPRLGPGQLWQRMADEVGRLGGRVHLDRRVQKVRWGLAGGGLEIVSRDQPLACDRLLSSMAMPDLVRILDPLPPVEVLQAADRLRHRDFLTILLVVDGANPFPDQWIYVHDPKVRLARVQNFRNWSLEMAQPGLHPLGLEYFCQEGDHFWHKTDDQLIEMGIAEMVEIGLLRADQVRQGKVVRVPRAYPVYDHTYQQNVDILRDFLIQNVPQIQLAGRNGMHRYLNQDHAMWTAMLAVRGGDRWTVNDREEYLEEMRLTPNPS